MFNLIGPPTVTAPPPEGDLRPPSATGVTLTPDATSGSASMGDLRPFTEVFADALAPDDDSAEGSTTALAAVTGAAMAALAALLTPGAISTPVIASAPTGTPPDDAAIAPAGEGGTQLSAPAPGGVIVQPEVQIAATEIADAPEIANAQPEAAGTPQTVLALEVETPTEGPITSGTATATTTAPAMPSRAEASGAAQTPLEATALIDIESEEKSNGRPLQSIGLKMIGDRVRPANASGGRAPESPPILATAGATNVIAAANVIEPARLSEAQSPDSNPVVLQITHGVEQIVRSGQTSLRLQLYPEDLGRIDLRLTSGADGLRVTIHANLPTTGHLLDQHLNDLQRALAESGINLAGVSIGVGGGQSSATFDWGAPAWAASPIPAVSAAPEIEAEDSVPQGAGTGSHVDYRI